MVKHACQYKIVRFAPFAETEEFANIGIVLFCPASARLEFKFANARFGRVTTFFEGLEADVYKNVIYGLRNEFTRIQNLLAQESKHTAQAVFTELTRTKGGVVQFSDMRAVLTGDVTCQLDMLFDHYVNRSFNTPVYREKVLERNVKESLKRLSLDRVYKKAGLSAGLYEITLPFVRQTGNQTKGAIKPLAFDQKTTGKAVEHADLWLSRAEHLISNSIDAGSLMFALDISHTEDERLRDYLKMFQDKLEDIGIHTADTSDSRSIAEFAQTH
ncbi:hypothetical protein CFI10_11325 [Marinobacterium iners]|uniref:DUF3037 domain-containing protein n=1 Tax=Marinobacterium iners TaxID=48076 RepID=UPI001A8C92EF|nr:DUF3037 domain-containing protein [Marinobacterium iners]QSR35579.1 hypothetical protein CFI10_11325 [Marinobacterium iners]